MSCHKFLLFWLTTLPLLAAPGDLDLSFGTGGYASYNLFNSFENEESSLFQAQDSKGNLLIVADSFSSGGAVYESSALFKISRDGTRDTSFGTNGVVELGIPRTASIFVRSDDSILIFKQPILDLMPDGSTNANFTDNLSPNFPNNRFYPLYEDNGKLSVLLHDPSTSGPNGIRLAKIESDGSFDPTFNSGNPLALQIESDKVFEFYAVDLRFDDAFYLFAPETYSPSSETAYTVYRFLANGTLDTNFNGSGKLELTDLPTASGGELSGATITPDQGVVFVYQNYDPDDTGFVPGFQYFQTKLFKVTSSGTYDTTFGVDGELYLRFPETAFQRPHIDIDESGSIIGHVYTQTFASDGQLVDRGVVVFKLLSNGTIDSAFGSDGFVYLNFLDQLSNENALAFAWEQQLLSHGKFIGFYSFADFSSSAEAPYETLIGVYAVEYLEPTEIGTSATKGLDTQSTNPSIIFDTDSTKTYSVWHADSPAGPWNKLTEILGDGSEMAYEDPRGFLTRNFYQVREE